MKMSKVVKPISYLKAHASEVIRDVVARQETLIITQNGEAKVVLQDIHLYEQTMETLALLKILAQSKKGQQGARPARQAMKAVRERIRDLQGR